MFPATWQYRHAGLPPESEKNISSALICTTLMNLEVTILSNLVYNEKYARKVLPFLKVGLFSGTEHKIIFIEIHEYISQYDALPSLNAIGIECQERTDLTEDQFKEIIGVLNVLSDDPTDHDWISWILQKSGVKSVRSTYLLWSLSRLLTDRIPNGIKALFLKFYRRRWRIVHQSVGHDYVRRTSAL